MCMIDGCNDSYTIYNPHKPTRAAKEHKCAECFRPIAIGETYYRASGLFDGSWERRQWQRMRGTGLRPLPKLPRPIALGDAH